MSPLSGIYDSQYLYDNIYNFGKKVEINVEKKVGIRC